MKNMASYAFLMIIIIVALPLLIVKGCGITPVESVIPPEKEKPQVKAGSVKIKVYFDDEKKVKEMMLEEYIKGVVAAEMPADFAPEALKAQSVAARTYAYGRLKRLYTPRENLHPDADVCTDFAHCQAWTSKSAAIKRWGVFSAYKNWSKIEKAVKQTENMVITYKGKIINPVFHANSGGKTENAEEVWAGGSVPYLRSVVSNGEDASKEYEVSVNIKVKDFCNKLEKEYPGIKLDEDRVPDDIKITDLSEGGRVKSIKIGSKVLKGTEFRTLFSLRSTNFKITSEGKDALKITTIGNGHGVGMSQWGANDLAKNGGSFEEILKHYYSGVELASLHNVK